MRTFATLLLAIVAALPLAAAPTLSVSQSGGTVRLYWTTVNGAAQYKVLRATVYPNFSPIATVTTWPYTETPAANTGYVYEVQPLDAQGAPLGSPSNAALVTTFSFTDPFLAPFSTKSAATHFTELRTAVNTAQTAAGVTVTAWSRSVTSATHLAPGDIAELRAAMDSAIAGIGLQSPSYDDTPVTSSTLLRAVHVDQLRRRALGFPEFPGLPPVADSGPGGPILVISSAGNPFSRYYGEILLAEGFNEYAVQDIANVTSATLASYDVAILGEMTLTSAQVSMLTSWVQSGGNLIAMRPDAQLASLLGLSGGSGTLSNAYLAVNTAAPPGAGIVTDTIQFHGPATLWSASGAAVVAVLYSNAATSDGHAAVTLRSVGSGSAAAFTYDLARSVVLTRQGNPAWSGQRRDGTGSIRPDDLFFGNASFDPQPEWIDFNKVEIPQADEQQRLLANLILQVSRNRKPLPRFWYLPNSRKAAVVMTGDGHANNGTPSRFNTYLAASPAGCSVANWECVRSTSYIYPNAPLSDAQLASYAAQGFEISIHLNTIPNPNGNPPPPCTDWTPASLEGFYASQLTAFHAAFPSLPLPSTNRTHCATWSDYVSQPKVQWWHGVRLDTTFYYWPGSWIQNRPGLFTGSGLPMRFADTNGAVIDVYQAPTQLTDESDQTYPLNIDRLLDNAVGTKGFYAVVTGSAVPFTTETIKGITYATFPASAATYVATYAP